MSLSGSVAQELLANPAGYYVNIHSSEFPNGAVRGQVLGEAAGLPHWVARLAGFRERPAAGDPDGAGVALLWSRGHELVYYLRVSNVDNLTAAHIHRGKAGEVGDVEVNLDPQFSSGVAVGRVTIPNNLLTQLQQQARDFYVNVHSADFPGGAVRGQLAIGGLPGPLTTCPIPAPCRTELAAESVLALPVVADNPGLPPSLFRTSGSVANFSDEEAMVWAEWYPASQSARSKPAKVVRFSIAPGGVAVFDNLVGDLLGVSGRGAIRFLSPWSIAVAANIFNDQRPALGTFGQFLQGYFPSQALTSGTLVYNSHKPKSDGTDWRTNLGWFNPNPKPATLTIRALRPDGTAFASRTLTLAPWSNDLRPYGELLGIGETESRQPAFALVFVSDVPVFFYSSVVDNRTDDGLYQPAQSAPFEFVLPPAPGNNPPQVRMVEPAGNLSTLVGQQVTFRAEVSDPENDPVTVVWDFGDGSRDESNSLQVTHAFATAGDYTVRVIAVDSKGAQAQDSRQVTVNAPGPSLSQLQAEIFTPLCSGCHPPNAGLDLRAGHTYASTVNVNSSQMPSLKRVAPGDPGNSYLYRKLLGTGISGARMPQGGPYLSQEQLNKVRDWILAGAPNN